VTLLGEESIGILANVAGPWTNAIPHFRPELVTPSRYVPEGLGEVAEFLCTEGGAAMRANPICFTCEARAVEVTPYCETNVAAEMGDLA
jgi:hypothetical protein